MSIVHGVASVRKLSASMTSKLKSIPTVSRSRLAIAIRTVATRLDSLAAKISPA